MLPTLVLDHTDTSSGSEYARTNLPSLISSGSSTVSDPIVSLPSEDHRVLIPIPVVFEESEDGWVAWFEHAGIGMSGDTRAEAKELLGHDILESFILYSEESGNLGPGPTAQFKILKAYIN